VAITYEQMQKNQKETCREEWFNFFDKKGTFDSWLQMHTADRHFVVCNFFGCVKKTTLTQLL